jgi:hypothetical protein
MGIVGENGGATGLVAIGSKGAKTTGGRLPLVERSRGSDGADGVVAMAVRRKAGSDSATPGETDICGDGPAVAGTV